MPPSPFELLEFLCATLARKPPPMPFRQGAGVARYLDTLAYELDHGTERQRLLALSKVVWGHVFQFAEFKAASMDETIQFLEAFAPTHLARYNTAAAIQTVRASGVPQAYRPPRILRSPNLGITTNQRMSDDLTERICTGYWAFRFAGYRGARSHVADALNRYQIPMHSLVGDQSWTGYEVAERVKQHEARVFAGRSSARKAARQKLVDKWNALYYPVPVKPPGERKRT